MHLHPKSEHSYTRTQINRIYPENGRLVRNLGNASHQSFKREKAIQAFQKKLKMRFIYSVPIFRYNYLQTRTTKNCCLTN